PVRVIYGAARQGRIERTGPPCLQDPGAKTLRSGAWREDRSEMKQKVHLIGICGTGMGSLAGLLAAAGHSVRGSDENVYPPISTMLQENGIEVMSGYRPSNLDWGPDLVVIGNIVSRGNPEGDEVLRRGLK